MQSADFRGIGMTSERTRDRMIKRLQDEGIRDTRVLNAIRLVPRHIFVDEALAHSAYDDDALPIGFNQALSRPYTVARMTELLLSGGPLDNVLEIGTGSGYQTVVLSQLVNRVFSVERIRVLSDKARKRMRKLKAHNVQPPLKVHNIQLKHSDGGQGWPEQAPFDGILAAAAPTEVPRDLLSQLKVGGRLVIPVGDDKNQELRLIVRTEDDYIVEQVEPARFVPFLSGAV